MFENDTDNIEEKRYLMHKRPFNLHLSKTFIVFIRSKNMWHRD